MELWFFCPLRGGAFASAAWEIVGTLRVLETAVGQKRVTGNVRVLCPVCGQEHDYAPEDLPCPFGASDFGLEGDDNKGGS